MSAAKKTPAKKDDSDSDSSDDSSDSDAPPAKKATPAAASATKSAPVSAAKAVSKAEEESSADAGAHKIYIKGLPWVTHDKELKDFFKVCGKITTVELPLDENGRSSGTAYITFSKRSELEAALELDGQTWPGTERWLKILESSGASPRKSFGGPMEKPEGCDTVFVGNLPWDVEEDQLRELFSSAGEIATVRFATDESGAFKGFGHIQFYDGSHTDAAVALAGSDVNGRAIRVDFAPPRQKRESFGDGGGRGGGRGGRDGGRGGRGAPKPINKAKGSIAGTSNNSKISFDD